jgi:predicted nucleotidyltransferase
MARILERMGTPAQLDREIARIFASVAPRRIVLFGSRARGDADASSDVDLLIVYATEKRFLDRLEELYALWDLPIAVDILAYTPEEFADMMEHSAFVAAAAASGRVVYEAA